LRQRLADARRAAGLLVTGINIEPEAEPARACFRFTFPPARRADWQPADWVRAEPAIPGLAVTREGDALCVVGLPYGQPTRVTLRQGLPAEENQRLPRDMAFNLNVPDRAPRLGFDNRAFILPRGQEARVPLALMNIWSARMQVVRVTERNLVPLTRDWRLGEALESWTAAELPETWGRTIWDGAVDLPAGESNRLRRVALPLPPEIRQAGPGLYMLLVRPTDGGANQRSLIAAQPVIVTDLGLTAWRGAGGLAVQARGLASARAEAGVRVALLSRSNDILAEAETGPDGLVRFDAPLLRGQGPMAPVALHASRGDDLVSLDLEAASFDLSDRGADGRPHPGPLDAFLWLDRGIYRPGETAQVMALLRDAGGRPLDLYTRLRLRRPNGQIAAEHTANPREGGAVHWPVALPASAPVGLWTVEAYGDPGLPPIGTATLRVDAFVPERLAVEAGPAPGPLVPGRPLNLPVVARFLYGAPAAGLTGSAELRLQADRSPFSELPGFLFGLEDETFAPDLITAELPELDAEGRATLPLRLERAPDTTRPLKGELTISVEEPGGRASQATLALAVAAPQRLLGIRPLFAGGSVNVNTEAGFELVATDSAGASVPARIRLRLVRERPDWRIVVRGGSPRFETVWTDEPVDSAEMALTAAERGRFARSLPFGRYRLEAQEVGGMALASVRFRSGWAGGETAEVPDKADVAADRRAYAPGETARLRITPPFAGRASVAVLTDRLLSLREVEVPEAAAEVEVPVDAAWGAGAHVAVTVHRPGEGRAGHPSRALGLVWVQVDPASRRLEVAIEGEARVRPNSRVELPIRVTGGSGVARLTVAAVDEGILRLTRFATPDPVTHFTGRRRLGTDIRDDYGRLIAPTDAAAAALRQGGDEPGDLGALQIPQRNVALFSGPVATDADGRATIAFDVPDFAGELRLMAVAWEGERIGAASRALTVRDALVAEALLPRFLAPGDEARIALLLHNLELPAGEVTATLTAEGAIALASPARVAATLATGARATPGVLLRATGAGEGVLRLSVTGPQGFAAAREARITVRSSRGMVTETRLADIPAGGELRLDPPLARFVPGTWRASARFGAPVRYDALGMLRALEGFPLSCTEQLASKAVGLSAALDEAAPQERAVALQRQVDGILSRQRFDGSFGLWSAQGEPEEWVTPYAVEALLRARAAGAAVAPAALDAALANLDEMVEESSHNTPVFRAHQAARLHALAMAGRVRMGAARRLLDELDQLPTPLARAQLAAVFARAGDNERANRAFASALAAPARNDWLVDFGSAARDALALLVLLREGGAPAGMVTTALGRLPGPELTPQLASTNEQAWAVAAAAALGRDSRPIRVALDGVARTGNTVAAGLTGPVTARNQGDAPLPVALSVTGIPAEALPAGRNRMQIRRRFLGLDGMAINLDQLRSGQVFILAVEGRAETQQRHLAMVTQGLPAGWEIVARLGPGAVPGFPGLAELSEPDSQPALDDRFAAAVTLTPEQTEFRFAVRVRATLPGRYELPGAEVTDMYRPAFFARQASGRITVIE
ncbi:MAG: alpha-2-macroglobulin family protein, partial [Acetobacteraceae bacterium]|nr:alpha-2-macroglobulin family protein [Acetobacteraceae bacterium]